MGRWNRYWFAEGGRTALAIVRIAVALAVLASLARLADSWTTVGANGIYRPVGVWMLLGHTVPPVALIDVLWVVAVAATIAMLVGFATRATTAISFAAGVALAALSFSSTKTWSHQYNVVFLAQLALLGARSGDTLSLDWLIRTRVKKLPALDVPRGYQWSLRLVQLAVVLMFTGAAFHKFAHGQFTLRWALSDNLRHHLLVKYDLAGNARPAFVDWLLAESWRYRTAALLNMITQAAPIIAVIWIRRPLVRAAAGVMFVIETILLGLVVGLWNLHWLPLVAVFIDWERLVGKLRGRPFEHAAAPSDWRPPRRTRGFIIAFIVYDTITAFIPSLDQRLNTYPFSGFPMFATIRAREPYSEHLPYSVVGGRYVALAVIPIDKNAQRWLDHIFRNVHAVRRPDELERRLRTVLERMQYYYPDYRIHGMRLWVTVFETAAYPGPADFQPHRMAVLGEITADGTFRTMLGKLKHGEENASLEVVPKNVALAPNAALSYFRDDLPQAIPIAVPLVGSRFDLAYQSLPGNPRYFVVTSDGTPWLVASHETWRWQ